MDKPVHNLNQMTSRLIRFPSPTDNLKIGLFGGSFDPAHSGHAHLARTALRRLQLDYVWWIPARGNPLKSTETPFEKRFESAKALATDPRMRVFDIEKQLDIQFTADLLNALKTYAPRAHFVWLMGGDNLLGFHYWRGWTDIAETVPIAVIARASGGPKAKFSKFARRYAAYRQPTRSAASLARCEAPAWIHLRAPLNHQSSTHIRSQRSASGV